MFVSHYIIYTIFFVFLLLCISYKLTDFDISERLPSHGYLCDAAGVAIGTQEYIAPA